MALALPARLLTLALSVTLIARPDAVFGQTPAGAPVDREESNSASDARPLRIGAVTLSGSLQVDATKVNGDRRDEYRDLQIRRARIGLAGNLTPLVGWNVSAELTTTPVLRNAFVLIRFNPRANLRIGQATPLTSIERTTGTTVLEFVDRTRITSRLTYPQDIGMTLYSDRPLAHRLNYAIGVINGSGFNRSDDNDAKDIVGRIELLPPRVRYTSLVISGATGEQPRGRRTRATAGVQVDAPRAKVTAEALREDNQGAALRQGFLFTGVYRIRRRDVTPHFRMIEVTGRYFVFDDPLSARGLPGNVDNAAGATPSFVPVTTREFQGGANYYANRSVRVLVNVTVPVDERTEPRTTIVSRFQVVF